MYIRRTQTRSNVTGERYYTYRLVRAERIQNKVRQVTLLNLGRHIAVDQALWPLMCQRIEALMTGQTSLLDPDLPKAASAEAERIAAQLLARKAPASSLSSGASAGTKQDQCSDVQAVDANSLELARPRCVGVEQIGLWAMRQIGFADLLIELGISGPLRAGIAGSIIGRMAVPGAQKPLPAAG